MRLLARVLLVFVVGLGACEASEDPPGPPTPPPARSSDPVPPPDPTRAACSPCMAAGSVEWRTAAGPDGAPRSALLGCRTYQRNDDPTNALLVPCEHPLPACDAVSGITIAQVEHVLASPDLRDALSRAPAVYGKVPRASDGRAFLLSIDAKTVTIGDDCDDPQGSATCMPVPRGVRDAARLLEALDAQEAAVCR
jgi:hypothetical protein